MRNVLVRRVLLASCASVPLVRRHYSAIPEKCQSRLVVLRLGLGVKSISNRRAWIRGSLFLAEHVRGLRSSHGFHSQGLLDQRSDLTLS